MGTPLLLRLWKNTINFLFCTAVQSENKSCLRQDLTLLLSFEDGPRNTKLYSLPLCSSFPGLYSYMSLWF